MRVAPTHGIQARAIAEQDGTCQTLDLETAVREIRADQRLVWLDLQIEDAEVGHRLLHEELGFHELIVEDALSVNERPSLQEFEGTLFLSLASAEARSGRIVFRETSVFLRGRCIVSATLGSCPIMTKVFTRVSRSASTLAEGNAFLMHDVLDAVIDAYFPILDDIEDEVDSISDRILGGQSLSIDDLLRIKRNLLDLRRHVSPARDVLNATLRRDITLITPEARPYFQDLYDHSLRVLELIDLNRDTMATVMDVHLNVMSNNLNTVMKKMTVVSTMLMSMALVTGVYGMNFRVMPELQWAQGYPFALGLMVLVGLMSLLLFRLFRWL